MQNSEGETLTLYFEIVGDMEGEYVGGQGTNTNADGTKYEGEYKDGDTLKIIGGAIWDSNPRILETHGVDIPDYFWKVIFRDGDQITWIMPNDDSAMRKALDTFVVSLLAIEKAAGYGFSDDLDKSAKAGASWGLDACDGILKWRS